MAKQKYVVLTGVKELDAKLKGFETKVGNRIAKSALNAGLRVAKKSIKSLAPEWMKTAIGSRSDKNKKNNQINAKVGVNVGKRPKKGKQAKTVVNGWAPVYVVGTAPRQRKELGGLFKNVQDPTQQQLSTGQIEPHGIVKAGMAAASGSMSGAMKKAFERSLAREVAKARLSK